MNLTLHLNPETEAKLREQAAHCGKTLEAVALEAIDEKLRTQPKSGRRLSNEQRIKLFNEWVESRPIISHFVDDSRESIYEGRGE